jgi:hypothetical protein
MSPGGHLVTTAATCAVVYAGTGSTALTAGLAAGGFLIDVDHVVDYVLFEGQRDLHSGSFLRYYVNGRARRLVLVLHSYELLAGLATIAWISGIEWLWGWVLGMLLHLPLDVVFNGKFASGGLVHFYSFIVRARAGFRADHFTDRARTPVPDGAFLRAFFNGGQLAEEPPRGRAAAAPRASEPLRG